MGAHGGPNIADEGLIFYYDTGNGKSYAGEPTTNLATLDLSNTSIWFSEGGTKVLQSETLDGYPVYQFRSAGSTIYISPIAFNQLTATSNDVTLSAYFRNIGTTTQTVNVFLANDFGTDSNGDANNRSIPADGRWYRQSWTRYAAANTYNQVEFRTFSDTLLISKPQVEYKKHATPPVEGTRSVTEGLRDLAGDTTLDLTDVSFDSNAQMTFDGTDDTVALGDSSQFNITDSMSVFAWIKPDSIAGWKGIFGGATSGFVHFQLYNGGINVYVYGPAAAYGNPDSVSIGTNVWTNVGFTFGGNTLKVYLNGEQLPTTVTGNGANISSNSDVRFGWAYATSRLFQGRINALEVYNRNLTPTEVKENFNGIKSRYGI